MNDSQTSNPNGGVSVSQQIQQSPANGQQSTQQHASQQAQQPVQYVQQPSSDQPQQDSQTTVQQPSQKPTIPVGGMKEGAPIAAPQEWVSPSTPEITPTQEVSKFVEVTPEVPQIPQAAQQVGVKHAKEATPVTSVKAVPINLSTPHPVLVALKRTHKSIKDSMTWLVSLVMKGQDKQKHTKIHQEKGDFFS